jgi:uncharacterized integral membrane protein
MQRGLNNTAKATPNGGGAGKNNNSDENVDDVLKAVQDAQITAKGQRTPVKSSSFAANGTGKGGLRDLFSSFTSPSSGEPMTRFNRGSSSSTAQRTGYRTGTYGMSPGFSPSRGTMTGGPLSRNGRGADGSPGRGRDGVEDGTMGHLNRIFGIDSVTRVMYVLKFMRIFVVAGALYLASKTFQTRYVTAVFVNNEPPPSLMGFVLTFVVIEAIFMSLILFIVMLLAKTLDINEMFPITDQVFGLFLFDSIVSSVLTAVLGLMIAMVVMKKKYFRYRTDGMRAIRSLQEMMLNLAIVTSLLPYYIIERN